MNNVLPLDVKASSNVEVTGREITEKPAIPTAEELTKKMDEIGIEMRKLIVQVKRLPRQTSYESHLDPTRSLALSQSHLQTGFMWLRRAIEPTKGF